MPYSATDNSTDRYLELLAEAEQREAQLEAEYLNGRATACQLQELEQVRQMIEDCQEALEFRGYFNPS
ncbi:MAG: hypothetical protein ABIP38_10560 [Steroidobacteraceae bacterium]